MSFNGISIDFCRMREGQKSLIAEEQLKKEHLASTLVAQQQTYLNVFQQMVSNLYTKILHCYFYDIFNRVKNYVQFAK